MNTFNCPNCGAALPARAVALDIATCEFCGTSFRLPKSLTPEPDMGDLLLGADFSKKTIPGWELSNQDKLSFPGGNPPELVGKYPANYNAFYVVKSSGIFDNFDASISMRYLKGDKEYIRAGFFLRFMAEVGYAFLVSAQASYKFGYFEKDEKGEYPFKDILPWTTHTALREGMNQLNRMRVICNNDSFRVYLNGVLAASFQDATYKMGKLFLVAEPSDKADMDVAFSDLQLREVPRE